jgi:hypothetical protein
MRLSSCAISVAGLAFFSHVSAAPPQAGRPAQQIELASLFPQATITWQDMTYRAVPHSRVLAASWSRDVMASLADNVAEDGTRYLQLPLVRLYDSKGRRLKLAADITDPAVTPERLEQALARMEVDESAPLLADDIGVLQTDFDADSDLPPARAYVIDYWAEWCRTSAPFHKALDSWQSSPTAQDVVLIRAGADFGRRKTASR